MNKGIKIDDVENINKNLDPMRIIRKFEEDKREPLKDIFFNFNRNDTDTITEIKKVILSCQRDQGFIIKVYNFETEEDPGKIDQIIYNHEMNRNKGIPVQDLDYINLKDSDTILLIVDYYIEVFNTGGENKNIATNGTLRVLILIPRIVDKYFYKISGNTYSATYQIVDGSIYNNSDKINPKSDLVAFKTGRPIRVFRKKEKIKIIDGEIDCMVYTSSIINKPGYLMRYLFAKMGINDALAFMGIDCIYIYDKLPLEDDTLYIFPCKNNIYITAPKYLYDNEILIQSAINTINKGIVSNTKYNEIFTVVYWVGVLSWSYNTIPDLDNGYTNLYKLEKIYDINTREKLKLPDKDKATIYNILFWIMKEFPDLRARDNTDMYYKRIRCSEYIALLYAAKLSESILNLADMRRNNLTVDLIKRRIYTNPNMLLQAMSKDSLININNRVNDNHGFLAIKASYKGEGGVGEKSKKSIGDKYRNVNYSDAGITDMTASSATDPGMTTLLCPMGNMQPDGFFYDYQEPNDWEKSYNELYNNYKNLNNLNEAIDVSNALLPHRNYYLEKHMIIDSLAVMKRLIEPFNVEPREFMHMKNEINLEESGLITYISE